MLHPVWILPFGADLSRQSPCHGVRTGSSTKSHVPEERAVDLIKSPDDEVVEDEDSPPTLLILEDLVCVGVTICTIFVVGDTCVVLVDELVVVEVEVVVRLLDLSLAPTQQSSSGHTKTTFRCSPRRGWKKWKTRS